MKAADFFARFRSEASKAVVGQDDAVRLCAIALIAQGHVDYSYLGIKTQDLTPTAARRFGFGTTRGAVVVSVEPGSPAAKAGLRGASDEAFFNGDPGVAKNGDVIVALDGQPVATADDVLRLVSQRLVPGQRATLTIYRGAERRRLTLVLGRRPANPPA